MVLVQGGGIVVHILVRRPVVREFKPQPVLRLVFRTPTTHAVRIDMKSHGLFPIVVIMVSGWLGCSSSDSADQPSTMDQMAAQLTQQRAATSTSGGSQNNTVAD